MYVFQVAIKIGGATTTIDKKLSTAIFGSENFSSCIFQDPIKGFYFLLGNAVL